MQPTQDGSAPIPPQNSGNITQDQRSEISERSRRVGTERETPARSQYTNSQGQGRRNLISGMRRGTASGQSPNRMQIENEGPPVDQINQSVYFGTYINEEETEKDFTKFMMQFRFNETPFYLMQLNQMMETDQYVLTIDGSHLHSFNKTLYQNMITFPAEIIPIFDRMAQKIFLEQFLLPNNDDPEKCEQLALRVITGIINLVKQVRVRELNPKDINHLVSVKGIVIRCSDIYPEMKLAYFRCVQCNNSLFVQLDRGKVEEPTLCDKCKGKHTFEIIHNLCQFTDKQFIKMQEQPENVPEGDTPQTVSLMAYDDNVDAIKPGDRITVTGVFRAQAIRQSKFQRILKSVYNTYVDVISYQKLRTRQEENALMDDHTTYSEEVRAKLTQIAQSPNIYEKLVYSFAPSIWEQEDVKKGVLCQLFGGKSKEFSQTGKGRFRAEINILLVGDPSTSKSQILKYVHGLSQRGIYTSGKGSSAVGLTVYVTRDPETREIVLESGALVLSDMGICCIDEFDKMDQNAKTILHEAMEQQTISVAKAGIVSQLNARTAVLAAANPLKSRYDSKKSVVDNINLPPTLLSRFDLIYLMLDEQHSQKDKRLAYHILSLYSHYDKSSQLNQIQEENSHLLIDRDTLSQYIAFARSTIIPQLSPGAQRDLIQAYVDMRKQGMSRNTITATPRQLESLIRLSEALAKMELNDVVTEEHVKEAVRLMQVATKRAAMDPITGLIDMDVLNTGRTQASRLLIGRLITLLRDVVRANINDFRGNGMRFQDLANKIKDQINQEESQKIEEERIKQQQNNDAELMEALKVLEEEQFVMLTGDRYKPRIRAGYASLT